MITGAWVVCAFSAGHPHRSRQLCDQSLLRLPPLAHRGGAGRRLHPRLRQEDGSERMVTARPSRARWGPRGSAFHPLPNVPLLVPQPCHDVPRAHGLGGEGVPAEASRGQHHERQVKAVVLSELFSLARGLVRH